MTGHQTTNLSFLCIYGKTNIQIHDQIRCSLTLDIYLVGNSLWDITDRFTLHPLGGSFVVKKRDDMTEHHSKFSVILVVDKCIDSRVCQLKWSSQSFHRNV